MPLVHHELCFGCGRTNLFGLLLDVSSVEPGVVNGRCFIKQDHQGASRGFAHEGVIAAALGEAMALACGRGARARRLELSISGEVPVGAFLEVEARSEREAQASAQASIAGEVVARARGTYAT